MKSEAEQLYENFIFRLVEEQQQLLESDDAAENVLGWLAEEDPHGIHTGYIVRELRASVEGASPEMDCTIEKRMISKLVDLR